MEVADCNTFSTHAHSTTKKITPPPKKSSNIMYHWEYMWIVYTVRTFTCSPVYNYKPLLIACTHQQNQTCTRMADTGCLEPAQDKERLFYTMLVWLLGNCLWVFQHFHHSKTWLWVIKHCHHSKTWLWVYKHCHHSKTWLWVYKHCHHSKTWLWVYKHCHHSKTGVRTLPSQQGVGVLGHRRYHHTS